MAAETPPCVLHEDDELLVVAKPAGWNTHAPAPFAGEGIYDWLRHREPRWAGLAIVHRLDRDTSGVMLFAKTPRASRELGAQFARHEVRKHYLLLTDGNAPLREQRVEGVVARAGDRYVARAPGAAGDAAVTIFAPAGDAAVRPRLVAAQPLTGRTHQIRVHAAASGFPVLGDALYGGGPAPRLCLHAVRITLRHPASGDEVSFESAPDFAADHHAALRAAVIDPAATDAFRALHGAADAQPGLYLDRLGDYLLAQSEREPSAAERQLMARIAARGRYHRRLDRQVRRLAAEQASPRLLDGTPAPERFTVCENGVRYELGFDDGYSVGLFLDQRDNRRRFLTGHVAAGFPLWATTTATSRPEVLNAFAYTCGFSVCAALGGARSTSLDLSKRYLERGRRNFEINGIDPADHDFIYGDAFDWFRRLARKGRRFDALVLDPPTFSQSKAGGRFRAEADYGRLLEAALPLLASGGVLLACANTARLAPEVFVATLRDAIAAAGRRISAEHYAPQPPDFPVTRDEPAYLKTLWLRI
ncbi:MAG: hypothetical protein BroJett010_25740 [Gammaproteobacteria bacterium]|nr:hypothetical protein [Gammaproteobacteria bacterium PRO2]GIK36015.1 MAG: hypothetical protein BroJett010_25740 [Gammaproteobacteria bacterium]